MTSEGIYYIYRVSNLLTGEHYIGFTKDPIKRKATHFGNARKQQSKFLYSKMREYGDHNFEFEILYCSKEYNHTLNEMENFFIKEFNSLESGYNRIPGGSCPDFRYETMQGKISIIKKNKRKFVLPEVLDIHIKNGWQRGVQESMIQNIQIQKKAMNKKDVVQCIEITTGKLVQLTSAEYTLAKSAGTHIAKNHGIKNSEETRKRKSIAFKGVPKQEQHKKSLQEATKRQHRIMVSSLFNKREYDIGNFAIHLRQMAKHNTPFDYFSQKEELLPQHKP